MRVREVLRFAIVLTIIEKTNLIKLPIVLRHDNSTDGVTTMNYPCSNFYSHACNSWHTYIKKPDFEPVWNPWIATSHEIKHRLSKILTRHNHALIKPQIFYRSCLRIIENEDKYLRELLLLVDSLGGWSLMNSDWSEINFDWFRVLATITRDVVIHPMLKISQDLDYVNPQNLVIYIEPGDLIFPQYILVGSNYEIELEAYERWILDTMKHMYPNSSNFKFNDIKNIIKFEMQLARLMIHKSQHERTTVKKLMKKTQIDILAGLEIIFRDFTEINKNTTLAIRNYNFFKNLLILIEKTDPRTINNYLIWTVVKELSRETTNHMRDLNFLIDQAILGVKDDLTREFECLDGIIKYFSPLLVPPYLKWYISPKIFPKIRKIFHDLQQEFIEILNQSWLSQEAKTLIIEKIKNIKLHLGFPLEIFNGTSPTDYYRNVQLTNDHFTNVLKLKQLKRRQKFQTSVIWPSSPFDVNAYYSVLQNSIFVPLGLLEPPFYHLHRDEILNLASLGFLIGHEMSHALDPAGILADSRGKIRKWLPDHDVFVYKEKLRCFGDNITLGENIADSIGLDLCFKVAKRKNLSNLDRFFMGYAQMWCEISENSDLFTGEEHSTNLERIQNLLKNADFRNLFECGFTKTCDLWSIK